MFFTTTNGTMINVNFIQAIVPIQKKEIESLRSRFSLQELANFGFKVGRRDIFVDTRTQEEAAEAVKKDLLKRVLSTNGRNGYIQLECDDDFGLISEYTEKRYNPDGTFEVIRHKDDLFFLPKERYNEPIAYEIHMSAPAGGMNHTHLKFTINLKDFEALRRMLAANRMA